jgi:hypothetical protein
MGCSNCKKNKNTDIIGEIKKKELIIITFITIWSCFALYGLYSLINNIF